MKYEAEFILIRTIHYMRIIRIKHVKRLNKVSQKVSVRFLANISISMISSS